LATLRDIVIQQRVASDRLTVALTGSAVDSVAPVNITDLLGESVASAVRRHETIVATSVSPLDCRAALAIKLSFNATTKMNAVRHHDAMDG
jgi:hypothetical protein